jgi:hypothetical protein
VLERAAALLGDGSKPFILADAARAVPAMRSPQSPNGSPRR